MFLPDKPTREDLLPFVKRHTFMTEKDRERFLQRWNTGCIDPWPFLPDAVYVEWKEKRRAMREAAFLAMASACAELIYDTLSRPSFTRRLLGLKPI